MIASLLGCKNHQVPVWRRVGRDRARGRGTQQGGPQRLTWSPDLGLGAELVRGEDMIVLDRARKTGQLTGCGRREGVEVSGKQDCRRDI